MAVFLLAAANCACAAKFVGAAIDASEAGLVLTYADGRTLDAPKYSGQVGFRRAQISPDGTSVGWLALEPNCCTSDPIALKLVVLTSTGQLHRFSGEQAIFGWCFVLGRGAVAYRQEVLHGPSPLTYQLRRIADGNLLNEFVQAWDFDTNEPLKVKLPGWSRCAEN